MAINRKTFFDKVRAQPFAGSLNSTQVAGMSAILDEWERRSLVDLRWLAYMLATSYHETARTMQPIHELGPRSYFDKYEPNTKIGHNLGNTNPGDGYLFRGRGYVQLTGRANYQKMHVILGVDLTSNPDLALVPKTAASIMFEGMSRGTFTGKKLTDYFNLNSSDYVNARRIINGTDRAELIAGYARSFFVALNAAQAVSAQPAPPDVEPINRPVPAPTPAPKPNTLGGAGGAAVATTATVIVANETKKSGASNSHVAIVVICGLVIALAVFFVIRHWRKS